MLNLYKTLGDLPIDREDHPIWKIADSDELKDICLFQIIHEFPDDVGLLTDAQCRSSLAKIQAHLATMSFADKVENSLEIEAAKEKVTDQEY